MLVAKLYRNPAAVSVEDGSDGPAKVRVTGLSSDTGPLFDSLYEYRRRALLLGKDPA